jgi:deoxyribonuclease V
VIACVDVGYDDPRATAACVLSAAWTDAAPQAELTVAIDLVAPYQPGEFFRRELPCLERVLDRVGAPLEAIVIDGFVWLARDRPGLGAHLYEARGRGSAVIGVAKNAYRGNDVAVPVVRGAGKKPLYVTAAGIDVEVAAAHVRAMHGEHRIPTLLAAVDRLSRVRQAL